MDYVLSEYMLWTLCVCNSYSLEHESSLARTAFYKGLCSPCLAHWGPLDPHIAEEVSPRLGTHTHTHRHTDDNVGFT